MYFNQICSLCEQCIRDFFQKHLKSLPIPKLMYCKYIHIQYVCRMPNRIQSAMLSGFIQSCVSTECRCSYSFSGSAIIFFHNVRFSNFNVKFLIDSCLCPCIESML